MACVLVIDNTAGKLNQKSWSEYIQEMEHLLHKQCATIHFAGGSDSRAPKQEYCWLFDFDIPVSTLVKKEFEKMLKLVGREFFQAQIVIIWSPEKFHHKSVSSKPT